MLRDFFAAEMPMKGARRAGAASMVLLLLLWTGCGETYRPVATPILPNPPNPNFAHYVITVNDNGPSFAGSTTRIDTSGDTNVGVAQMGLSPVHAALLPNATRGYIANSGDDTITSYLPTLVTSITTISLPAGSVPVFVHTTEPGTVYVANSGNNTVSAIDTGENVVTDQIPVGVNPVALAETPNGLTLYVANQGKNGAGGSVSSINTIDRTVNPPIASSAWTSPVWVVARSDSQRVYVLDSGSGTVSAINTASNTVVGTTAVGTGANFMLYDPTLNRLYVTNPSPATTGNPSGQSLSIIDASTDALTVLANISFAPSTVANAPCPAGCTPVSVAALPDGSRAYVASYVTSTCSGVPCIVSQVTVISALTNAISSEIALGSSNIDLTNPTGCSTARFRLSTVASADSSRVYVAECDAGNTGIIATVANNSPGDNHGPDTLIVNMPAPLSAFPIPASTPGGAPPPQNPVFVLASP
jgi:YVTN family beta-propeller protein